MATQGRFANLTGALGGLRRKDDKSAKADAKSRSFKAPEINIGSFLTTVAQNRKVFWVGFGFVSLLALGAGIFRGLWFARDGMGFPSLEAFLFEAMSNLKYVAFALGFLFAMPMDTIPGKGKFKEFLGDFAVGAAMYALSVAASNGAYVVDIFVRGSMTQMGLNAEDTQKIAVCTPEMLKYGVAFIVILAILIWASRKSSPEVEDE